MIFGGPTAPPGLRYASKVIVRPSGGDDAARLQAVFDTFAVAGGGEVEIDGLLQLASGVTYSGHGLKLTTTSKYRSGIATTSGFQSGDVLTLQALVEGSGGREFSVHGLRIENYDEGVTPRTSGVGLKLYNLNFARLSDIFVIGQYDGVKIDSPSSHISSGISIDGIWVYSSKHDGIWLANVSALYMSDITMDNAPTGQGTGAGIRWNSRDAVNIDTGVVLRFATGFLYDPTYAITVTPGIGHIKGLQCDSGFGWGYDIRDCQSLEFIGCEAGYNAGGGVILPAPTSSSYGKGFSWLGGKILGNTAGNGIQIAAGNEDWTVQQAQIGANANNGIALASSVGGGRIIANRIASSTFGYSPLGGSSQLYGFSFGGSHANMIVMGNDTRGNGAGNYTGTPPSGAGNYVAGNTWQL